MNRPVLHLSASVLRSNIIAVREKIAPSELMLVMKDDAYGHGISWVAEVAQQVGLDWFGTYDIRTAIETRRALQGTGRLFAWATSTDAEIDEALLQQVDLGVGSPEYLRRVIARASALGVRARVHLKIDTGLHRNGLLPQQWAQTIVETRAAEDRGVLELVGVWSHLAEASDAEDDDAQDVFCEAVRVAVESGAAPTVLHLTASAASWWRPELRGSLSRIGAFCYGIRSADGPELDGIRPVAELTAPVLEIAGGAAVMGIGAFDGLPSSLAGAPVGTPAGARQLRAIDATTASVQGWPGMRVGDDVRIFGRGTMGEASATTLAERIDTVGEEILTRLTPRVRRAREE